MQHEEAREAHELDEADEEREVRLAAGRVLVGFGDDFQSYPGQNFRHEYTHAQGLELQAAAAQLLPAAERLLADEKSAESRRLGARLLWRLEDPSTRARLLELTGDRDEDVRYAALGGLSAWREDKDVREAARERRKDPSHAVRDMVELILEGPVGKVRE